MKRKAAISADAQMSESGTGTGPKSKKGRARSGFLGEVSCSETAATAAKTRTARDGGEQKKVTVHKVIDLVDYKRVKFKSDCDRTLCRTKYEMCTNVTSLTQEMLSHLKIQTKMGTV